MNEEEIFYIITEKTREALRLGKGRTINQIRDNGAIILGKNFLGSIECNSTIFDALVYLISQKIDNSKILKTISRYAYPVFGAQLTNEDLMHLKELAFEFIKYSNYLEEREKNSNIKEKIRIQVNNINLNELAEKSYNAIVKNNIKNPRLFVMSGMLVRVLQDENGRPIISHVNENTILLLLSESVEYVKLNSNGNITIVDPPTNVIKSILGYGTWKDIPPLKGISMTPLIHTDGSIPLVSGYDLKTSYYLEIGDNFNSLSIPGKPNKMDLNNAISTLLEPFKEFPFVDSASFAHILAALFTVMIRHLIKGPVPLLIISKPQMGTGASKICEIIALITTGRMMNTFPQPESESEMRKAILSKLAESPSLVILDNCEGNISSPIFASLLTSQEWSDRVLGKSLTIRYPHRIVWIANGNNIKIGKDLPRRVYCCYLDAEEANPWEREGFLHPDILSFVNQNRIKIVSAVLTIVKSWILDGLKPWVRPLKIKNMGGFESWSNMIGGILDHAGIEGFLHNQEFVFCNLDDENQQWEGFLLKLKDVLGDDSFTISEVVSILNRDNDTYANENSLLSVLPESIGDLNMKSQSFRTKLGMGFSRNENRVFPSGIKLMKVGELARAKKWKVILNDPQKQLTGLGSSTNTKSFSLKSTMKDKSYLIYRKPIQNPNCHLVSLVDQGSL